MIGIVSDKPAPADKLAAIGKDLCMQVVHGAGRGVARVGPRGYLEKEKDIYCAQVKDKPAQMVEKIVEGKMKKFSRRELSARSEVREERQDHRGRNGPGCGEGTRSGAPG